RVRRSAAALGLRTEASHRFGRGVDPGVVPVGLRRAAGLLAEWAGAAVEGAPIADRGRERPPAAVELRPQRVEELTGLALPRAELVRALASVDLPVEDAAGALRVHVPGHRYDLEREADLVEEVVRRVGYDRVPVQPLPPRPGVARGSRSARIEGLARRLLALGLDEAYTSTFFDPAPFGRDFFEGRLLQPLNPLAQSERHLRPSLAPTLLLAARRNLRRGARGAALFEIGHVFEAAPEPVDETRVPGVARGDLPRLAGVVERRVLGFALAGAPGAAHWSDGRRAREADFFDAKGVVEAVVGPGRELSASPSAEPWLHPGQQAELRLGGEWLGFAGRLHPRVERALDLEAPAIVAEMALAPLIEGRDATAFAPLSPFPWVERDVALVVPDSVPAGEVLRRIHGLGLANLTDVRLFDLYRGVPVPLGARSLAFRLVFQSAARTLTDAEVEREMARLVACLDDAGLHLR
ncbi:MAG: phenylalanine--tRNA ligase subunit beta, partial [Gemmatimonadota bacterium]